MMASIAHSATIRPSSSHSMPNTMSVLAAKNVFQPAAARALAEQAAGGGRAQCARLLIARAGDVLPHVAPGGEALRHVRLDAQHQCACHGGGRHGQQHGRDAARAHEGDDEEGRKEDERGAEVAHQGEPAHADGGKGDEEQDALCCGTSG